RLFQHRGVEPVGDGLAALLRAHQPRLAQHGEMGRERGFGSREMIRDLARAHRPRLQQLQDGSPGRVGERLEYGVHSLMISETSNRVKADSGAPSRQLSRIVNYVN